MKLVSSLALACATFSVTPAFASELACAMCGDYIAQFPAQCPNDCPKATLTDAWAFPTGTVFLTHEGTLLVVTGAYAEVRLDAFVWAMYDSGDGNVDIASGAELVARCAAK